MKPEDGFVVAGWICCSLHWGQNVSSSRLKEAQKRLEGVSQALLAPRPLLPNPIDKQKSTASTHIRCEFKVHQDVVHAHKVDAPVQLHHPVPYLQHASWVSKRGKVHCAAAACMQILYKTCAVPTPGLDCSFNDST
eukprot:1151490-Pelagomonas_calceolata.AAC.3